MTTRSRRRGFTLIELMIVVAIIGTLAGIAIPKFAALVRKSGEGATKGNLGALRSAISIYYGDMEGQFPGNVSALTIGGKYFGGPFLKTKTPNYHSDSSAILMGTLTSNDGAGWLYNNVFSDSNAGSVVVNCTDTDTKGTVWTKY